MSYISEIFSNSRYWQEIVCRESVKVGANLEHIFNIVGVKSISMYHHPLIFGFLAWYHHLLNPLIMID